MGRTEIVLRDEAVASLEQWFAVGGGEGLARAKELGPEATIAELEQAGLRGRGDTEVRARRARMRALERLSEQFAEDFEHILREERNAEGL